MESPRPSERCRPSDASFSRPNSPLQQPSDSVGESQQCSADPSAFVGFHVPLRTDEEAVKEKKQTRKFVLDLDATSGSTTKGSGFHVATCSTVDPYFALFAANTQDDEKIIAPAVEKEASLVQHSRQDDKSRSMSPSPTILMAVDLAWRARRQSEQKEENDDLRTEYSDYSEDLAPRIFHDSVSNAMAEVTEIGETEDEEIECTQPLEEDELTGSYERLSQGEGETQVSFHAMAGTFSALGASSSWIDNANETREKNKAVDHSVDEKEDDGGNAKTSLRCYDNESHVRLSQEALTPRVRVPYVVKPHDRSDPKDEQEVCAPTQPSTSQRETNPLQGPILISQQEGKSRDDQRTSHEGTEVVSQTKAIRSLEYSFSMPEPHDQEPQLSASLASDGTPAPKRIEVLTQHDRRVPFESSISPVYQPTRPSPVKEASLVVDPIVLSDTQHKSKRINHLSKLSGEMAGLKKLQTSSKCIEYPKPMISTPTAGKRKRDNFFSNGGVSSNDSSVGNSQTSHLPPRRSSRSTQSTPPSTPQIRTRTRTLTPVPSLRAYASRSRTLFKYKFEFCLTGFVKGGEQTLKDLIEGHGGKIPERYQDVLYKGNPKAVVIATPVSWRKRKFMQAVACGIPVLHTDWIKDCIDTGYVIPFEGYQVPTGYSVTTGKFECFPPKELHIFHGYSFGIASDGSQTSKSEAKDKAKLMAFLLKACGAHAVYEDLTSKSGVRVDVVLCDEYTATCQYYKNKCHVPIKDFQWVTECMILQRILDPKEPFFEAQSVGCDDVCAVSAAIGDNDNSTLKLYTGELVMADISGSAADHYLLFNVCEIVSIHVNGGKDESKRKENKECSVMLRVGMLRRKPYNPELSKTHVKRLDISSSQVKRRVVAISKEDYGRLKYKDESIFYLEDVV